jgi:hypothetical protein
MTEQTNIALVSALFATICYPMLFLCDGWSDDNWIKGVYGLLNILAITGLVVSVVLSVLFVLAINECSNEDELSRFQFKMNFLLQLPFICFFSGTSCLGAATAFWIYNQFDFRW